MQHNKKFNSRAREYVVKNYSIADFTKQLQTAIDAHKFENLDMPNIISIMNDARNILNPFDIKLIHDLPTAFAQLRALKEKYKSDSIVMRTRFILTTNRYKANFSIPIVRESNGCIFEIFEAGTIKLAQLAAPPNELCTTLSHKHIERILANGTVYEVKDGTSINIYYDPHYVEEQEQDSLTLGKWIFATRNSFDIGNLCWRGFTYNEIISDVLRTYDIKLDDLQRGHTYSIGFRHPSYHPFLAHVKKSPEMWLIKITPPGEALKIPVQEPTSLTLSEMLRKCENSLAQYIDDNNTPCLGFIIRAAALTDIDVLIESQLWHTIRHMVYQLPFIPNRTIREHQEQLFKDINYVILHAFMHIEKRELFIKLFPQFAQKYELYSTLIARLADKIITTLNKYDTDTKSCKCIAPNDIDSQFLVRFVPIIRENWTLRQLSHIDKKMIRNMITNPRYIDIYYEILHKKINK